jgi:rRNA maturation protein Nop10
MIQEGPNMEGRKIALVVGLFVIVIALVVIMGKRAGLFGGPKPPQWVMEQSEEKIDVKSLKVVKLSIGQWEKLGRDASGRYKNPDTGEYTMAKIMICAACGAQIPAQELPTAAAAKGREEMAAQTEAIMKIREEYKCPVCGKSPFVAAPTR